MSNDQPTRFWNKPLPIWQITAVTVLLVLALFGWLLFAAQIDDLAWGIRNSHTAKFEGHQMRLPLLWKQTEEPAGMHILDVETSFNRTALPDSILISKDDSSSTAAERIQHARESIYRLQGATPELTLPWQGDLSLSSHYSCLMVPDFVKGHVRINCYSNSSNWTFMYIGDQSRFADAATILRNLIAWENSSK